MCGINGIAGLSLGPSEAELVERMNTALVHRGPDEGGVAHVGSAVLGMQRLSIVDLGRGRQPMRTPDGRYTLVYNGEIYDAAEHRDRLATFGAEFTTTSDTEVLLHAWAREGEACLGWLNGMFGFAVWDNLKSTLTLVRDSVGIKPLYYHEDARGGLAFSSELPALMAHPAVERRLDPRALSALLVDRCVHDPWTLLDGVHQLPPGHILEWRAGQVHVRPYAPPMLWGHEATEAWEPDDAADALRGLLDETVRSHLVADVPVGVFLSGGVDSSTVAALAARAASDRGERLSSFSVGFAHPDYDESAIAREVAAHLETDHHELRVDNLGFDLAVIDRILDHVGQPLGDPSCIPTFLVSQLAREHVKVALSGDGGDELFGGYDHVFWAARIRRMAERAPAPLRRAGAAVLAGLAPMAVGPLREPTRRARKGLALTLQSPEDQLRGMMSLFPPEDIPSLLAPGLADCRPHGVHVGGFEDLAGRDPEEFAMGYLARTYMPAAILAKVDRMSMAASLEVRVPLLDRRIVEFASSLPLDCKIREGQGKWVLREAGRSMLPASVYSHKKQGFSIPLCDWFSDDLWALLEELFAPGTPAAELFAPGVLDRIFSDGRAARRREGKISHRQSAARVWVLALLGRWMQRFGVTA